MSLADIPDKIRRPNVNNSQIYQCLIRSMVNTLTRDLANGYKNSTIKIRQYGPDDHFSDQQKEDRNKAVRDFCETLVIKGYQYETRLDKQKIVDFMEGLHDMRPSFRHTFIIEIKMKFYYATNGTRLSRSI